MSVFSDVRHELAVRAADLTGSPRPASTPPAADSAAWIRTYARLLIFVDALALMVAGAIAVYARFGETHVQLRGVNYLAVALLLGATWMAALALSRCYEARFLGEGSEEYNRVGNTSIRVAAFVSMVAFATKLEVARGFLAVFLPAGFLLLIVGRYAGRLVLRHYRRRGRCSHRVVVVGLYHQVRELIDQMRAEPSAGFVVVGACVPGDLDHVAVSDGPPVPVVGSFTSVVPALAAVGADTVAVAPGKAFTGTALQHLSYELEGTGVDLLVSPSLTNVTGTRISIRPIAGLPLLHVEEPELSGARKVVKTVFDRSLSLVGLLLLLPLLLGLALVVRVTSPGPALFRQERVGRDGELFRVWKLRTMYVDAEARRAELEHLNEHDGVLFKIANDPRITPVGRWLRKFSLDELPQLVNVLKGDMSLVGPRPPLASEVEQYEGHAHRRLLVKPGITGLWQVSGRSDLSWEETVRLDLRYVENWSLALDISVLCRTVAVVVRGSGAY